MAISPETFQQHILEAGILDPDNVHHVLAGGMHGQKLDFDKIDSDSQLYKEWVEINVDTILEDPAITSYRRSPAIILGVANGTNRLALDVAERIPDTIGLETQKGDNDTIRLTRVAKRVIEVLRPELLIVLEDVGTTGTSASQAALEAQEAGAFNPFVLVTWQRSQDFETRLRAIGLSHGSIIKHNLTAYSSTLCKERGFCSANWELIPRKS